jgi:virginiamycin B lyase
MCCITARTTSRGNALALIVAAGTLIAPLSPLAAATALQLSLTEWTVPISMTHDGELVDEVPAGSRMMTRPRDPAVDSAGNIWFCGQTGNYIGRLDPRTAAFRRYDLPPSTNPHNLIIDDDDFIWYAGNRNGHIGRLDPGTGEIRRYDLPNEDVRDPHTLVFDRGGNIWFTAQQSNYVGLLDTTSGEYSLIAVPHPAARPYGIVMDGNDHPWIALFGTNRLATVDPATMKMTTYTLPDQATRPRRLAVTSDNRVWYGDYRRGYLGLFDPATGEHREWQAPGGEAAVPYALTVDDRDRIWFVESPDGESHLVAFDTASERFIAREAIASGGLVARYAVHHEPSATLWFGTDANTIVRASLPDR